MRFDNPLIAANQRDDGHGLGRRNREVIKDATIGDLLLVAASILCAPGCLTPLRQKLTGLGMEIVAEPEEGGLLHVPHQREHLSALSEPLAGNSLTFRVVISDAKMFLKIRLRVGEIVLRLRSEHRAVLMRTRMQVALERAQ